MHLVGIHTMAGLAGSDETDHGARDPTRCTRGKAIKPGRPASERNGIRKNHRRKRLLRGMKGEKKICTLYTIHRY